MTQSFNAYVSVCDPFGKALEEVKTILFSPFDLKKWFIIGFCVWLTCLGAGGGGPSGPGGGPNFDIHKDNVQKVADQTKDFITENITWLVPVVCVGFAVMLLVWLVLVWLSSRGQFMFLHCVAQNKAEVQIPWTKYGPHGNSLFLFRIVFGIISSIMVIGYILAAGLGIFAMAAGEFTAAMVICIIFAALGFIFLCIVLGLIGKFTRDFVVPIMYLKTTSCVSAWREFLKMLSARKGAFFLYLLFQLIIGIVIETVILAMILITCCCAACVLVIPYIGTVFLLPVLVFKRAYSLHYLRQFGPEFDVFASRVEPNAIIPAV
jgi:hypothetical protein